ncbi:hypothetical protein E2320_010495 [Naja naja]|nr:hypothetical protein E2320_010495 [Naja naja]
MHRTSRSKSLQIRFLKIGSPTLLLWHYLLLTLMTFPPLPCLFSQDASLMEANSFSPSMPTSPSSMINQYKFEDEPEGKDLFITVDDPESYITTIETFITYRIVTKTTRGEFDSSEYEVRRRYQDFLWLKGRLEEAHPTLIIPPLPEKFIMKGVVERFNEEFIETRRKALHKFLNRIADHPTLTFNEDFKIFLTAQAEIVCEVLSVFLPPPSFFQDYFNEMREFGPIHTLWSASEEDLEDTLKGMATGISQCCKAADTWMAALSENFFPVIHEYLLYNEILMGVLKRRDQIQAELDSKTDAMYNKKAENGLVSN